ncbi:7-O-carbamoyltransferase [Burkholderiales bacterium]|nr:7-O-carbamoyltransferase [Burkholderiales bacterium]
MNVLGISAYYHDSAAALVTDGRIVAAAQEERYTRRKHDAGFPGQALRYCLAEGGCALRDLDHVVFYDKPLLKFERLLETCLACAPRGFASFLASMPVWLGDKLYLKATLRRELATVGGCDARDLPPLLFAEHHQSHAASAFFPSPFERAAVLCLDGVGEWATTSVWLGEGHRLHARWQIDFPHSLGLLYSAFTYYCGFRVNSGEYKLMGLAPYGEPRYAQRILDHLLDLKDDGTFRLDMRYFGYAAGLRMTSSRFDELFGGPPRDPRTPVTRRDMDLARSIQAVTEEVVLRLARSVREELKVDRLCLAGGVALNCVANGRVLREAGYRDLWIQPAAGDAGGAVGAALAGYHEYAGHPRIVRNPDAMEGGFLGPRHATAEVRAMLDRLGAPCETLAGDATIERTASLLADGKVVGWFQGRMEFGPRALGGRSILGDPRSPRMQSVLNLKIKHRESFRPFAPAVKAEAAGDWFDLDRASPYMMLVAPVSERRRLAADDSGLTGLDRLHLPRSTIPAVTHVDHSARVQTVHRDTHPRFHALLEAFERHTGCPVLVNTSFNVRGEPIVCTPEDAYRCFMGTGMDALVIEDVVVMKDAQPPGLRARYPRQDFAPD